MKPKSNANGSTHRDLCQTPEYALTPLIKYIRPFVSVWESASGKGFLFRALQEREFDVTWGDILYGQDFFSYEPDEYDVQVTNPPYRIKYQWLKRSYELNKPFALLLPVETLGAKAGQILFSKYGVEIIFMHPRIDFYMPSMGWAGKGAQFPVAWFTWKLNIGQQMTFVDISEEKKKFKENLK